MSEHIIVNGYFNSLSDVENDTFILSVRNDHRLYPSIVVNAMDNYNEEVENFLFNFSDDDNVLSHIGGGIYSLTNKAYSILQEYDDKDFDNEEVENFLFNFSDDDNVLSHIGGGIYSLTNKAYSIL